MVLCLLVSSRLSGKVEGPNLRSNIDNGLWLTRNIQWCLPAHFVCFDVSSDPMNISEYTHALYDE